MADQVGVRELRERLSSFLDRVQRGEQIEVTERGRPVAMLVPLPESRAVLAELVATGKVTPADRRWAPQRRRPVPPGQPLASEILRADRAAER
ncbi:type II toxin-antitoxin system Phd/YefM family antitoxin [Pseudonocardia nigra]|uniref:type II toxin-antitoxin system Phd/YefM family antitoxin n=1 Tax=Pseudonocardia nigra TaxID=1921578 RepID=UPI001C5FE9E5|nr:type II toxin-antitoxin system prevent-host-death family antitoxin [Pseudonocardia nigra]